MTLPRWRPICQRFPHRGLTDSGAVAREQISRQEVAQRIRPGMRVAVGVGSRGIKDLLPIVRATIAGLRDLGAEPFVVPAMGSHGGATVEGQVQLLAEYGITEPGVGAPIRASMETVELGQALDGVRVFFDRIAYAEADAVVPVARIKPHTDFRGEVESGLHKMLAIGFGKHRGASYLHSFGFVRFHEVVPSLGQFVLEKVPVPFGIAIVEDSYEDAAIVEAVPRERFAERERELLIQARAWLPRLPFASADVLLIQEIGKNISGAGMDPNVVGRYSLPSIPRDVDYRRIVVMHLTEESHGNAAGIGFADIITRRCADRVDWHKTYVNQVTSNVIEGAKQPLVASTDREALAIAIRTIPRLDPERTRLAWIRNTLELSRLWVSEPLWDEIAARPDVEPEGDWQPVTFDAAGALTFPALAPSLATAPAH